MANKLYMNKLLHNDCFPDMYWELEHKRVLYAIKTKHNIAHLLHSKVLKLCSHSIVFNAQVQLDSRGSWTALATVT